MKFNKIWVKDCKLLFFKIKIHKCVIIIQKYTCAYTCVVNAPKFKYIILTLLSLLNEDHRFLTFFVLEARLADANGFLVEVGPFVKLLVFPLSLAVLSSLPLLPVCDSVSLFISAKNNTIHISNNLNFRDKN